MIPEKTNHKCGALVTVVALCLSLMFPIVQFTIIDLGRLHTIREQLKFDLSSAASGAVTFIDWDNTYTGEFKLNVSNCADALYQCLRNNIDPTFTNHAAGFQSLGLSGGVYRYRGTIGNVTYYAEIYNSFGSITLGGNSIPGDIASSSVLTVNANKPAVFIVATYNYNPGFLRTVTSVGNLSIIQYASAELRSSDYEFN